MRFIAALFVLGFTGCSDNTAAPTAAPVETPAPVAPPTTASAAPEPEPVWVATGPAQTTIPDAYRGRWDATAESCLTISDAELKVADSALTFWEVGVDVKTVTPVGANAIRMEGTGYEADEHFDWTGVFQLSQDGSSLTMNPGPNGFARVRCLTPDFPGPEKN